MTVPAGSYARVVTKSGRGHHAFWAKVHSRGKIMVTYQLVNEEGEDYSRWSEKKQAFIVPLTAVHRSLIISEKPADFDRKYGNLKVIG